VLCEHSESPLQSSTMHDHNLLLLLLLLLLQLQPPQCATTTTTTTATMTTTTHLSTPSSSNTAGTKNYEKLKAASHPLTPPSKATRPKGTEPPTWAQYQTTILHKPGLTTTTTTTTAFSALLPPQCAATGAPFLL